MIRYVLLAAAGCGLAGAVAAQPPNDRAVLDKVFADWKARQGKMKTARYVLSGTTEYLKSVNREVKVPSGPERIRPVKGEILFDFERGRVRLMSADESPTRDGGFSFACNISTFDGKERRVAQPRDLAERNGTFNLVIAAAKEGNLIESLFHPLLYSHGIVPNMHAPAVQGKLPMDPDPEVFIPLGRPALGGRPCQVLRTEPKMVEPPHADEFWTDPERLSAVRRHLLQAGDRTVSRTDIDWQETTAGWWAAKWAITTTFDGQTTNSITTVRVDSYEYDPGVTDADFTLPAEPGMKDVRVVYLPGKDAGPLAKSGHRRYRITDSGEWVETGSEGVRTMDGVELPLPSSRPWWHYAAAGGAVVGLLAGGAWVWHRRRTPARLNTPLT